MEWENTHRGQMSKKVREEWKKIDLKTFPKIAQILLAFQINIFY